MPIAIKMPALSPTMEEGTLSKWLISVGDEVSAGDIMAEIETDKATMEFEAVDEGVLAQIVIAEGTENIAVGTVIAMLAEEGEDVSDIDAPEPADEPERKPREKPQPDAGMNASDSKPDGKGKTATPVARRLAEANELDLGGIDGTGPRGKVVKADIERAMDGADAPVSTRFAVPLRADDRIIASPLARRLADDRDIALADVDGSGPGGRIIKADVDAYQPVAKAAKMQTTKSTPASAATDSGAPYEEEKLSSVRKVIARRLTQSKQTVPHYYLTSEVRLDALLDLRRQLNAELERDGIKLSVNDMLIKALAKALMRVPQCNVSFHGDMMRRYARADISVAVAAPSGLITPIITDANVKSLAAISAEMKALADKAREGKLQPHEYQGGTASLSNLGMFGIKQFDAVINPPQGMILAVGAGQQQPYVVDGAIVPATVLHASGSFDHRAIDGADGAQLMEAIKQLIEQPIGLVV